MQNAPGGPLDPCWAMEPTPPCSSPWLEPSARLCEQTTLCSPAKPSQCRCVPGTLVPLHRACCQCSVTRFWLTVIHVAASASHRLSHRTLCRFRPSSPIHSHRPHKDARLQALGCANSVCQPKHINFAPSLRRLQQSNPHHVPNHLHNPKGVPTGSSATRHSLWSPNQIMFGCFYFSTPPPLPPFLDTLNRGLGVLWGRKCSVRGISPYQH